ncbi:MAG: flagellar motor protein MotB [Bauldia sp.]
MARKKGHGGGGGGHGAGWVVTFADLVSLLMAFFVMIVSFSTQDSQKVAQAAGSIQDAFGIQPVQRPAGMIERDGLPVREFLREMGAVATELESEFAAKRNDQNQNQGPEANTYKFERAATERSRQFLSAATAIHQALADNPEVAQASRQVVVVVDDKGLNIRIVDEDGLPMFAQGSAVPTPAMTQLLTRLAPILAKLPNRVRISGHVSSSRGTAGTTAEAWRLSSERALASVDIFARQGLSGEHIESVIGKADTEPLYPNDPFLSGNRRIEITVVHEAPPFPPTLNQ